MKVLKKSVKEQVLDQLREEILNQTYPLGSRVNLDELRREYGVSNTPLREAIGVLVGEGLLEYRRNAGFLWCLRPERRAFSWRSLFSFSCTAPMITVWSAAISRACWSECRESWMSRPNM